MKARYRYRFYPTDQQKQDLAKVFGCARYVWNEALAHCQSVGKYLGYNALAKRLTELKRSVEWLKEVSSVALQQALRHLHKAYERFFDKLGGLPRFKKRRSAQSITLTTDGFSLKGDRVYLAKIGTIKPIWSRPLPSAPSSVTVIKDCAERYFVSFVVEVEPDSPASGLTWASKLLLSPAMGLNTIALTMPLSTIGLPN